MKSESEIKKHYKAIHDILTANFYNANNLLQKAEFDKTHGQIWKDMEEELIKEGYQKPQSTVENK